ncbi:carboxylesterase/lipase family protein [Rhodococcus sp. D2-41]|uniref:Carboxylic ester hydrolase n=1 Tax=Speluncibacter jeojiensis TaxID=2710754 RepID=A0A9X4RH98_9ACTN|nr:carboxylesterase/lipase family protein [Rhodococcus sp. D2-41]MDG3011790.1 carboxylesterase/lipase family protein [Rhodococcus sp. D2-41]MDG3014856.1 carboxylesterase/lipase family protein [Corynebacteriales bacterium D3-21]
MTDTAAAAPGLEVATAEGRVRGRVHGDLLSWRGIPYATPPVGALRLRAPQPMTPWTGVRGALDWGFAAPQPPYGAVIGPGRRQPIGEDCLTLNVLAPRRPSDSLRPVMVFIHGGGYLLGTSALSVYGGQKLVERGDVVYVSLNYRLGPLGYLDLTDFATPDRPIDSNLGLRDQVAALEWVQRNIEAFGGDPRNVTVFGESAGGNAVTTLFATPAAEGLFARGIAQSSDAGVAYGRERSAQWGREFVACLGADPSDAAAALDRASLREIGRAAGKFMKDSLIAAPGTLAYAPVVDDDYLPKHPVDAMADGSAHAVPLMIGTNSREGALFTRFLTDGLPLSESSIATMFSLTEPAALARVTSAYRDYPRRRAAVDLGGDALFWKPSTDCASGHSRFAPTYSYRYDFTTPSLTAIGFGATHAMELIPVFGLADTGMGRSMTPLGGRKALRALSERMQAHWLSFARGGEPLSSWPAYDEQHRKTMIFDATDRVECDPRGERRRAWEGYLGYR